MKTHHDIWLEVTNDLRELADKHATDDYWYNALRSIEDGMHDTIERLLKEREEAVLKVVNNVLKVVMEDEDWEKTMVVIRKQCKKDKNG